MEWLLIIIGLMVLLFLFFAKVSANKAITYPYQLGKGVFSNAERSFYGVLLQAVPEGMVVLAKVRVADILQPKRGMNRSDWQIAFNKISAKHFDFVLCDAKTLAVKLVVELDDASHQKKRRVARDKFLDAACKAAGLELKRVKAKRGYVVDDIRGVLFGELSDVGNPDNIPRDDSLVKVKLN